MEELQASAASGADPRSREALLSALPALLRERAAQVLDVDTGAAATGALEKLCLCLKGVGEWCDVALCAAALSLLPLRSIWAASLTHFVSRASLPRRLDSLQTHPIQRCKTRSPS
jgi:hypothetical protein